MLLLLRLALLVDESSVLLACKVAGGLLMATMRDGKAGHARYIRCSRCTGLRAKPLRPVNTKILHGAFDAAAQKIRPCEAVA
ncbi:MAG: hypothetical protein ABI858_02815 [Pseudoxanthomonas sp.]